MRRCAMSRSVPPGPTATRSPPARCARRTASPACWRATSTPPSARFAPGELDAWIERTGFAREPVVTRVEPDVNSRSLDLAQVHDVHRVEWTGYLVPPETGIYRLGLGGFNGELEFDGEPFVD